MRDVPLVLAWALAAGVVLACLRHRLLTGLKGIAPGVAVVLACAVLLVVQRVSPFERVWLMFLPLGLVTGAAGLMGACQWLLASERFPAALRFTNRAVAAQVGVLLAAVLAYQVWASRSVLLSDDTGAFPDAAEVTTLLQQVTGPRDAVRTSLPAGLPELQYHFRRLGLNEQRLVGDIGNAPHVFLVVDPSDPQSLAAAQSENRLDSTAWSAPVEVGRFPSAVVYELNAR
jgi:hypothetical protein